jgi:hypothetical protein
MHRRRDCIRFPIDWCIRNLSYGPPRATAVFVFGLVGGTLAAAPLEMINR